MKEHHIKKLTTTIILFIFFFLLFFIPLSLFIITRNYKRAIQKISIPASKIYTTQMTIVTPSITPTSVPLISIPAQVSPMLDPQTRLLEKIQNRQPLTHDDIAAKNRIVLFLPVGQTSGIVYKGSDFTVDYVQDLDLFQVEVINVDVEKSKKDALNWFAQEGMSRQGICNLPIEFYLNSGVKNQISNPDAFNPLPVGC